MDAAELAGRQHGAVHFEQLRGLGLSARQIHRSLDDGRLHSAYAGVYFVGHVPPSPLARYMAATLATNGVASHHTAAALFDLWPHRRRPDVSTTARTRSEPGLNRHFTRSFGDQDLTTRHGIPCTTLARTLVDLADHLDADAFEALLRRVEARYEFDRTHLRPINGRRGYRKLTRAHELTRSGAERAFRRAVQRARLPKPQYNHRWRSWELDAYWPEARLVVEIDGYAYHRSRDAFRKDRAKQNAIVAAGLRVLRFTYEDVVDRPHRTAITVKRLLAAR